MRGVGGGASEGSKGEGQVRGVRGGASEGSGGTREMQIRKIEGAGVGWVGVSERRVEEW